MKKHLVYWLTMIVSIVLVFAINLITMPSISTLLWILACFGIMIVPYFLFVYLFKFIKRSWFDPNKKMFHVFKFEKKWYELIRVKKWKDKIPELGQALIGFDKSKIQDPKDPKYLLMYLNENCRGDFDHLFCILWGWFSLFIVYFVVPFPYGLTVGIPVAVISCTIHYLSLAILRYVRPKFLNLYNHQIKRQQKEKQVENVTENNTEKNITKDEQIQNVENQENSKTENIDISNK